MIVHVDLQIAYSTPCRSLTLVWHWCQTYRPLWTLFVLTAKLRWRLLCRNGSLLCQTLIFPLDTNPHDTNYGASRQFIFFFSSYVTEWFLNFHAVMSHTYSDSQIIICGIIHREIILCFLSFVSPPFSWKVQKLCKLLFCHELDNWPYLNYS